jgi:hypothetical protein
MTTTSKHPVRKARKTRKPAPAPQAENLAEPGEPLLGSSDEVRDARAETLIGTDQLGEALAEAALERATGGDDPEEALRDQDVDEDEGGPFVITTGSTEFAHGTDESNPPDAFREPLPRV